MIRRNVEIRIDLAPEELAKSFCDMDGDEQATFFNCIELIAKKEWEKPFESQVQWIIDSKNYTDNSRKIMRILGEYAN
jgi:hypothetical protein